MRKNNKEACDQNFIYYGRLKHALRSAGVVADAKVARLHGSAAVFIFNCYIFRHSAAIETVVFFIFRFSGFPHTLCFSRPLEDAFCILFFIFIFLDIARRLSFSLFFDQAFRTRFASLDPWKLPSAATSSSSSSSPLYIFVTSSCGTRSWVKKLD